MIINGKNFYDQPVESDIKLDGDSNATDAGNNQSMFILTILENEIEIFTRKCNSIIKDDKLSRTES